MGKREKNITGKEKNACKVIEVAKDKHLGERLSKTMWVEFRDQGELEAQSWGITKF